MEFWGVEVKSGETLNVSPGEGKVIHLSQAAIGESKKGKDDAFPVYVKIGDQKLVIGTLSADKFPQIQYDVVFEQDFELSHNWKNGSIYFCGYKTQNPEDDDEIYSGDEFDSESGDEELPIENGKPELAKAGASKPVSAAKPKVKIQELPKDATADGDEDSSDDDDLSDSDDDDVSDDDEMDEDDSSEEDEETPTPKKDNKKRPSEPEAKTPVPSKKAKLATPQKTDGKKATAPHTATPHPLKQGAKTPKTPASAGSATCKSCSKSFNSEKALESHSKAKHAAK